MLCTQILAALEFSILSMFYVTHLKVFIVEKLNVYVFNKFHLGDRFEPSQTANSLSSKTTVEEKT